MSKKQVLDLYHYYKYDFLAFDYYYEDYMKVAETMNMTTISVEDVEGIVMLKQKNQKCIASWTYIGLSLMSICDGLGW